MNTIPPTAAGLDTLVWRYGRALLVGGFATSLLLVFAITCFAPGIVPFVPIAILGATTLWWLFQRPLLNLCVVLGAFALISDYKEGIDPLEIAYAAYYLIYLTVWFFQSMFLRRERLLEQTADRLVLGILMTMPFFGLLGLFNKAPVLDVAYELQAWTMLAFYFPIKDACRRYPKGVDALIGVLIWFGVFVVVRNVWTLTQYLQSATMAWQITMKGRVVTNEMPMMIAAFVMLGMTLNASSTRRKILFFMSFLVFFFGLVMTQGRGYWLAFAVSCLLLFIVTDRRGRIELTGFGAAGILGAAALIFVLFSDVALLLWAGLWSRLLSIGSATSSDVSLIGRFIEWQAVWEDIVRNPILGYGMGVPIQYFDLTIMGTRTRPWIHNGYLSLWFKYGVVGLGLVLSLLSVSIRSSLRSFRLAPEGSILKTGALTVLLVLVASLVSTIPSNAWFGSDTLFVTGWLVGMASGISGRFAR